ncbi:hypothetical protein H4R22_000913 [Coemansia sp. RSA 1290]|nr:hypothetical protein H4R22_000913 [Coemansia sp. RSA 1290]
MVSKIESESLYGSSIYHEGNSIDESDLPDYAQLCRRLLPDLNSKSDVVEPEAEENMARYLKYLTRLPLASLKMEPTLLQSDLQRISKELTTLLLSEAVKPTEESEVDMFEAIYNMDQLAVTSASSISTTLDKTQDALTRLEAACTQFTMDMSELEQRTQVIQRVLDKQDLITRFVELPRVMQMCVAGGYYQEAVDIAEHVRVTGDRLVQDLRDGAHVLPGSVHELTLSPESREQLLGFIGDIQKQVHAEFENMVLDLCRELSYANSTKPTAVAQLYGNTTDSLSRTDSRRSSDASFSPGSTAKRRGSAANGGSKYEKAMKRLSQVAKIIGILRHIGMFTETELQMLYLRSRWQAWSQTAESLNGFAPLACLDMLGEMNVANEGIFTTASTMTCVPTALLNAEKDDEKSHSSAEVAAYLAKYLDAFFSWLAEVEIQYRTLFSVKVVLEKSDIMDNATPEPDPFIDLATFASQQLLSVVLPMFGLLDEAPGIVNLQSIISTHKPMLLRGNIDFALPHLTESLRERAFVSVVQGIEKSISAACKTIGDLCNGSSSSWERLAARTRPLLDLPEGFTADLAESPSKFLEQFRVSPVGLLQYPLLAELLHKFRNSLHALRILVLADDDDHGAGIGSNGVLILLSMSSVVFESELTRMAEALTELCAKYTLDSAHEEAAQTVKDACVAFVFGLVRNVAEIFEEVTTLNDSALALAGTSSNGPAQLYSSEIYTSLVKYL